MSSKYVTDLRGVGQRLENDGFAHSALIVLGSADRMERMENTIVEMNQVMAKMEESK